MHRVISNQSIHAFPQPLNPLSLPLISELHPHEEVMKLEKVERKNGGGVVGR